ncbi:Gfo/Idh/MocA family oxidoreductase [Rhizobium sp. CSW-27]|uniref:Gfo/Idh/MocA family protein n=1 Tax=Rhizobium sp. CSW-27 TaxID=2839985 RepID=UPI001C00C72A|nr:Gfo/Idh/MocA family oxidoreductase [Rhizobium sp. CSW-27]MBT9370886.1 Gfo/Idh/MocA family oxidoreductase [Rhizobium sp. CSW-27]
MNILAHPTAVKTARLGFLGVGWIGRHRMQAMLETGHVEAVALADPSPEMAAAAESLAPDARVVADLDALLAEGLDGVVIATPSALHAGQAIRALEAGVAVFCQKPLGRSAAEVATVVEAARASDRLLGVDLSYRETEAMQRIKGLLNGGELGTVFAAELTFHNAYGPDKPWFYDRTLSGGGCVADLGVHLVDLALWALDFPQVEQVSSCLLAGGQPVDAGSSMVEDYAVATLTLAGGTVIRLACSWRLQAGCDAIINASFYGTQGGASLQNVDGSFYTLTADRFQGTTRELLAGPQDDWGGKAAQAWVRQLVQSPAYDRDCAHLIDAAGVLDRIYGRTD